LTPRKDKKAGRKLFMNIKVGKKAIAEATQKLKNWGRWGKDDQIGALNLITAAKRRQGFGLVKEGFPVSTASSTTGIRRSWTS
jgi:hypothetical protein